MHGVEEEAGRYERAGAQVPIAIVGMGCRLPGADTLDDGVPIWAVIRASTSGKVVRVGAGESLKEDGGNFTLPPDDRLAYRDLFERLTSKATRRVSAICLWPLEGGADVDPAMCVQAPLALAAELQHWGLETDLLLVTQSGARIEPDEPLVPPCAASAAVARGIGQECRTVHATALDIEAGAGCGEQVAARILDQLCAAGERSEVALRGRSLWGPTLVREAGAGMAAPQLCERGDAHVIFGGTGHVGLSLAQRLATSGPEQRIILVCRSGRAGEKALSRIEEMRGAGAEVSVIKADITERDDVLSVLRKACENGGRIAHVVHAAGVVDPAHLKFIRDTGTELAGEMIAPHVAGAEALAAAVDKVTVDKVVLCSSLSSFVGGLSYAAHAAGHRYLDAVGLREAGRTDTRAQWIVIDYDTWLVEERAASIGSGGQTWAILPDEGWEVFRRACAMGSGRYAISTPALGDRPGYDASDRGPVQTLRSRPAAEPSAGSAAGEASPARTEGENVAETVTACFEEVLGMTDIDPQANFFELGGESLLMLDFIDLVKVRSGIVLPQADAFNALTLSDMIALCEKQT